MLEAARAALSETDNELIVAILDVHKSIEKERNALTHGHLGVYSELEDGICAQFDQLCSIQSNTHFSRRSDLR